MLKCFNLIEIRFYAYRYASSFLVLWHIIFETTAQILEVEYGGKYRPPYWPETESMANMGRGMITRPIWKCPCIKLFITYFVAICWFLHPLFHLYMDITLRKNYFLFIHVHSLTGLIDCFKWQQIFFLNHQ
jgi:hypothetical protein